MFTKKITNDDRFITLPSSAQALYLHLSMNADDDGFCNQVATSMFKAHATTSDLELLLKWKYVYQFDDGVIVIKHWRMANALRKDRYTKTTFQEDMAKLDLDTNGAYTMTDESGCRLVAKRLPQDKLGEDRLEENSISCQEIVDLYHEYCPSLSKVRSLSDTRKKHIKARLQSHTVDEFREVFERAEASDWCTGRSSDWKADLDWIVKSEDHFLRILEGRYDNRGGAKDKTISDMRDIVDGMTPDEYMDLERTFNE